MTSLPSEPHKQRGALLWLFAVLLIVTAIRIHLLNTPLERDEGEFAYGGQLMLQGVSIYKGAYTDALKLPGTCAAYAMAMALFGQTTAGIHIAVILVTLATAILVFFLARRICSPAAAVVASGTYALLSITPPSFGLAAHATHFVMLPAVAGIFLLQDPRRQFRWARIFLAGLLLGTALLMKQTGAVFGIFAAIWLARCEWLSAAPSPRRLASRLVWLGMGGLLPFIVTCILIGLAGDWHRFWLWTFEFAHAHAGIVPLKRELETALGVAGQLFMAAPGLWSLSFLGLVLLFYGPVPSTWRFFTATFFLFSVAAVYPGWRGHYFIQLFPAAGLLSGVAFDALSAIVARMRLAFSPSLVLLPIYFVGMASPLLQWSDVYFTLEPTAVSRVIYGINPFAEAIDIGHYLGGHCPPDSRIAVLGSEPEIYFYSHRRAATGYIVTYALMEPQPYALQMQKEMINEIEQANPDYVVFVHVPVSWLQYSDSKTLILDWFPKYQRERLRLVGLVEIPSNGGPDVWRWFEGNPTAVQISAQQWIAIFARK
ncbi:MAG TPA: glycosyltransferase family 39 protein [Alphaproteobacteria bacterium]|nr:glycosyltransferase family 39 protein [Alphaproteobacteria bacterium]